MLGSGEEKVIKRQIDNELWIELDNSTLWDAVSGLKIAFKGGGNTTTPKIHKSGRFRPKDLDIRPDSNGIDHVHPNPIRGISFSTTVERIQGIPINGVVWKLPKGTLLPEGLVFNLEEAAADHPLLNVSRRMTVDEFILKLDALASKMVKTNHVIGKKKRR